MKMSPKRKPLQELTNQNNATNKRTRSHKAATSKAAAAISELVSATAERNKEQHSSDIGTGNAVLEPTSKPSLLPKPQKKKETLPIPHIQIIATQQEGTREVVAFQLMARKEYKRKVELPSEFKAFKVYHNTSILNKNMSELTFYVINK